MGRMICPLCEHYLTCKFRETLIETSRKLEVEHWNDQKFRKWIDRFARFCMFFKLNNETLDSIPESLDFIFHDFIIESSEFKEESEPHSLEETTN